MTTAHTPGPWFASGTDVKPLGNRPLICWTGTPERALSEARANARLIAAAPRLLAALAIAEEFMSGFEDDETQEGMAAKMAEIRAAIAAATQEG